MAGQLHEHRQRERAEAHPEEDQRRRREIAEGDRDEHERRAPDRRQRAQHQKVATAHTLLQTRLPPSGFPSTLNHLSQVADQPIHRALGLTDGELQRIVELLGREPNHFELAVFSLLWSEHCGYKHSALLLKRLPSEGKRVLQGPGENAGVIDLGDGEAVCFKVESHNHPSAVEPFQGAATGVGGILRDIIAMGARPIALLDGLRFAPADPRFDRAVAGIGAYGNSVGVPTVGGEAVFDEAYRDNVLVNAMCVGLLPADRIARAGATGPGNLVVLYGATTGRDGIGGASVLASQELGEDDADKRPTVQVGDPFMGKKLIEVSVELVESGLVESLQDCGAAGLASSLSEMARECGIDLRLDAVPLREEGMEPWEVMISESQERMVAVVRPQMLDSVLAVCERWELHTAVIGEVTDTGLLRALWEEEVVGEIPARLLTDECPRYRVEPVPRDEPSNSLLLSRSTRRRIRRRSSSCSAATTSAAARRSTAATTTSSARAPSAGPGSTRPCCACGPGTAVSPCRSTAPAGWGGSTRARAAGSPCSRRRGTSPAPAPSRSASPTASTSATPRRARSRGSSSSRSRGWPRRARRWGSRSSRATSRSTTRPTAARSTRPRSSAASACSRTCGRVPGGWREGDVVLLAGASPVALAGSEYQARFGEVSGRPARLDLEAEAALVEFLWRAAPHCSLVHDVSLGGLAVALAKAALHSGIGAEVTLPDDPRAWFGEGGGQAVLACAPGDVDRLGGVPIRRLGTVGGDSLLGIALAELRGGARLMCGVFGIRSAERDVARLTYFGLFALQHRGQEAAGIAVSDRGRLTVLRDMGLVAQVFDEEKLQALPGQVAIGHTRYSTTGSNAWANAQPLVHHGRARTVAIGHNGNLTNTSELRTELAADRIVLGATSDTEAIAALIANDPAPIAEAVARAMPRLEGAYSVVALSEGKLLAFRDPQGIRPLALGRLGDDWVVASETCAFDLIGAVYEREVRPGELVVIDEEGVHATQAVPEGRQALCIFEHVYFARPDSTLAGSEVHGVRVRMGERLASRGAGRGRSRDADPGLGHAGGGRLHARLRDPVQRGADQEPLCRPHVHPAGRGPAPPGDPDEVQPAGGGRRQAARDRRRLDRARLDDAAARRGCCSRPARPRCTSASPRRRSSRRASTGSTWPTRSSSRRRTARSSRCAS